MSYLLFAATKPEPEGKYVCETCNVLLEATTAEQAYKAAELWAKDHRLNAIEFESSDANKPIGELIDDQMEKRLKRIFDS